MRKIALLDFWAPWCAPCLSLSKTIDRLMVDFGDNVEFNKISADEDTVLSERYNIRSLPTVVIVDNAGKVLNTFVGVRSYDDYAAELNKWLQEG